MTDSPVVIIGAGPAGLTAGHELLKSGIKPLVLERSNHVGGLARTETYKGYRFDIGGHRFFTTVPEVHKLWEEVLGDQFIKVPRLSRIYYNGRFFNYPLSLVNVVRNLGVVESLRILLSYAKACIGPARAQETFEDWVSARFGYRLYNTFFKTYTEKVWGIPCREIRADWAAQRIKGLSLISAVKGAIFGARNVKSLIHEFHYPRLGPGQMWQRMKERIEEEGGVVQLKTSIRRINCSGAYVQSVSVEENGKVREIAADFFVSSMPISELVIRLHPSPPTAVLEAAHGLKYRDFIIVALVIKKPRLFPDNWIYIHTPKVRVGRIQNFKNWSMAMVPDQAKTCLGMEYFCSRGDDLWQAEDCELVQLATQEIEQLGLADAKDVEDGHVIRQPKAYPVYDGAYRGHLEVLKDFLSRFDNLQTIGRNGMHRYNNQDHSMLCGLLAARNLLGEHHDLWEVNTERSYYEEQRVQPEAALGSGHEPTGSPRPDRERAFKKAKVS
jgi:protoporphyrinogen oxidase